MMLFTASSTTLQFTLLGMIDWEKNFVLPLVGAAGAAFGQQMIGRLVKKYNRQSFIIFGIAIILGLATVLLGFVGTQQFVLNMQNDAPMGFKPLCIAE